MMPTGRPEASEVLMGKSRPKFWVGHDGQTPRTAAPIEPAAEGQEDNGERPGKKNPGGNRPFFLAGCFQGGRGSQ